MKPSNVLFAVSVACLVSGLADLGPPMISGFCRAIGAVLFSLSFIARVVEKAEATS